jgi:hypothetical protein
MTTLHDRLIDNQMPVIATLHNRCGARLDEIDSLVEDLAGALANREAARASLHTRHDEGCG